MDLGGNMLSNFRFFSDDEILTMTRGDTVAFGIEIDGLDQALDSAYFTCKKRPTDEEVTFQKSLGNGIELVNSEYLTYSVRIAPEDTATLDAGKYYYDLQLGANDDIYTVLKGILEIEQDVTN